VFLIRALENKPICCPPEEAVDTVVRTKMDVLVLGDPLAEESDAH
jgi:predicted NodU family carbamoyl transferase